MASRKVFVLVGEVSESRAALIEKYLIRCGLGATTEASDQIWARGEAQGFSFWAHVRLV